MIAVGLAVAGLALAGLALVLALAMIVDLVLPAISEWRRRRSVVRDSAAEQRLRAMRAAQELSLMAWQARHALYRIANESRTSTTAEPPIRRE
jgi:hypothetical protein